MPNDKPPAATDDRKNFSLNDARQIVRDSIEDITRINLDGKADTTKLKDVRINDADTLDRLKDAIFKGVRDFLGENISADIYFEFQDYAASDNIRTAATSAQNGVSAARA